MNTHQYIGRFAPSPTGHLHLGSLAAAIASYLDARAHKGLWLIRIEDVDQTRCKQAWTDSILETLKKLEMHSDRDIIFQSQRTARYDEVFQKLKNNGHVFGCSCSRSEVQKSAYSSMAFSNKSIPYYIYRPLDGHFYTKY